MSKKFSLTLGVAVSALLIAAVAAVAAVTAGNTGWRWGNPLPQGNALTTVESVGNRVYAAGATGTLLRSDDAGSTWNAVRTGLLDDIRQVRAIGPDTLVFAGSCALRRSDDAGATVKRLTWGPSDESCSVKIRSFHFPSSAAGYLLLESGEVFATGDGGASWTKKTTVPGTSAAGGSAASGDIWFTAVNTGVVSAGNKIYQTTDGATSWTPVSPALPDAATIEGFDFVSATDGYAVGAGGTVLSTTNGGTTWGAPDTGSPAPVSAVAGGESAGLRSISCASVNVCLVANSKGNQLIRTLDAGVTWSAVSPVSNGVFGVGFSSLTRATAVGTGGATVVSNDAGATWATISSGAAGAFTGLRAQSATTAFAFGAGGALARTTDGGNSWGAVGVSTSEAIVDVAFPSAEKGFVLDANGVLLRSNNAGASWQFLDTGTSAHPRALAAPDDKTVVLVGPKGVRRSGDSGDSFGPAAGKGLKKAVLSDLDKAGSALFVYGSKTIYVSTSAGKSWKRFKTPSKVKSFSDLDMVSVKAGYLLDTKDELWVTRNAGKKWTRVETTGANETVTAAFGDMKHGYLTDFSGRVLYTADAGKTWSRQYPFFDANNDSGSLIDAPSGTTAFLLVYGTNRLFATNSGGTIGSASSLKIKASSKKVKKNAVVKVTGKLSPVSGGERVTVLARPVGAKSGTNWISMDRPVSANGTFTTAWKIKKPMIFIARWSGDSARDGDAAPAVIVKLKK